MPRLFLAGTASNASRLENNGQSSEHLACEAGKQLAAHMPILSQRSPDHMTNAINGVCMKHRILSSFAGLD